MATTSNKPFAVVTGASSGIGYELARQFAENGYDLLIAAEDEGIQNAAQQIGSAGAQVTPLQVDLTRYDEVEKLYSAIQAAGRPVDAIAINAGVGVGGDFATETSLEKELSLLKLNVLSTVHLAKRITKDMVARGQGRILFTSSIAGTMPTPLEAVYGASKAFVLAFAHALRYELKDRGITVTALMPGPTDTNFFHRAGMDDTEAGTKGKETNDPVQVAKQGFEALMDGKEDVFASSLKTKIQGTLGKFVPESVVAAQHEKMVKHGSDKE